MADADDVRRLALALPHVTEIESEGFDFRVANKGFIWSYPERTPGRARVIRTDIAVLFVGDEAEKQALVPGEPDRRALLFGTTHPVPTWRPFEQQTAARHRAAAGSRMDIGATWRWTRVV